MTAEGDESDTYDPWLDLRGSSATDPAGSEHPASRIETIEGVEPLDAQLGAFPKKTVPDALSDVMFGQPGPIAAEIEAAGGKATAVSPMQTYAILDAAQVINLPELLEDSGLEHCCLFKGSAYDELKNVAPWIVRLEEGNSFTRNLFSRSDAPWHLWDTDPGIYVRSRGTLEEMARHFRKFTRVQDESGKWFYFRFWKPFPMLHYIKGLSERPRIVLRWFGVHDGTAITVLLLPLRRESAVACVTLAKFPDDGFSAPINLTASDRATIAKARVETRLDELSDLLARTFPEMFDRTELKLDFLVRRTVSRMQQFGLLQAKALFTTCAWELAHGPDFELRDPEGILANILRRPIDETQKIRMLRERMVILTEKEVLSQTASPARLG